MAKALVKRGAKRTSRAEFLDNPTGGILRGRSGPTHRRNRRQTTEPASKRFMR